MKRIQLMISVMLTGNLVVGCGVSLDKIQEKHETAQTLDLTIDQPAGGFSIQGDNSWWKKKSAVRKIVKRLKKTIDRAKRWKRFREQSSYIQNAACRRGKQDGYNHAAKFSYPIVDSRYYREVSDSRKYAEAIYWDSYSRCYDKGWEKRIKDVCGFRYKIPRHGETMSSWDFCWK